MEGMNGNYKKIETAIDYLSKNYKTQPSLKEVASVVHLSEFHFQRIFTRWAGISPKKFLQYLSIGYAKAALRESKPLLDVAYTSGYSSASRLYDLFVQVEAMTPGDYKANGRNLTITFGYYDSPFGRCLIATTEKGICRISFVGDRRNREEERRLRMSWPESKFAENERAVRQYGDAVFRRGGSGETVRIGCLLKGTRFQIQVWEALLKIPFGTLVSYQAVAKLCGVNDSSRAVAGAIAANPVAYLIPCHRVIRKSGALSDYRWGAARKSAIIGWEAGRMNK